MGNYLLIAQLPYNSPEKRSRNGVYHPGNGSKQIRETHRATEQQHAWLHTQQLLFIQTLPRKLCGCSVALWVSWICLDLLQGWYTPLHDHFSSKINSPLDTQSQQHLEHFLVAFHHQVVPRKRQKILHSKLVIHNWYSTARLWGMSLPTVFTSKVIM